MSDTTARIRMCKICGNKGDCIRGICSECASRLEGSIVKELTTLLNKVSRENESDTLDFLLAEYMMKCLEAGEELIRNRGKWHSGTGESESVNPS